MTERLPNNEKLRRRQDYQRCYRGGRRRHGRFVTVHYVPNSLGHPRLGITATRKVGSAVVRNLAKRRVREIYRRWAERQKLPSVDLVVHLKPAAAAAGFEGLRDEVLRLLIPLTRSKDEATDRAS